MCTVFVFVADNNTADTCSKCNWLHCWKKKKERTGAARDTFKVIRQDEEYIDRTLEQQQKPREVLEEDKAEEENSEGKTNGELEM